MRGEQLNRRSALKTLSASVFFGTATVGRTAARTGPTDTASPTDLGVLEHSSRADDINANGTIVGRSRKTIDGTSYHRAVRWTDPTSIEELGTLRDDNAGDSFAHGINNRGTVVGAAQDNTWAHRAIRWTETSGMEDLGSLGGSANIAFDINSRGDIVGRSDRSTGAHAFRWTERGGMEDLGTLRQNDSGSSTALGITDNGVIFGHSETASGASHGFRWTNKDGMIDLGTLSGVGDSVARDGHTRGTVVGRSFRTTDFDTRRAVKWMDGELTDLGTLYQDNSGFSEAFAVNNRGVIVGFSQADVTTGSAIRTHAVRWIDGEIEDLGTLRDDNSDFSDARGINSRGTIVGQSREANGTEVHAACWGC